MSVLLEKMLVLAISIVICVGAILGFVDEIIPLLKQILEAYGKMLTESSRSPVNMQNWIPLREVIGVWRT